MFRHLPGMFRRLHTKANSLSLHAVENKVFAISSQHQASIDDTTKKALAPCSAMRYVDFQLDKGTIFLPPELHPNLIRLCQDACQFSGINDVYFKQHGDIFNNIHNAYYVNQSKCMNFFVSKTSFLEHVITKQSNFPTPQIHATKSNRTLRSIVDEQRLIRGEEKSGAAAQNGIFSSSDLSSLALSMALCGTMNAHMVFFLSHHKNQHVGHSAIIYGDRSTLRYIKDERGEDIESVPIQPVASYDRDTRQLTIHDAETFVENQLSNLVCYHLLIEPKMAINLATLLHSLKVPLYDLNNQVINPEMLLSFSTEVIYDITYRALHQMYLNLGRPMRIEHLDANYKGLLERQQFVKKAIATACELPEVKKALEHPKHANLVNVISEQVLASSPPRMTHRM